MIKFDLLDTIQAGTRVELCVTWLDSSKKLSSIEDEHNQKITGVLESKIEYGKPLEIRLKNGELFKTDPVTGLGIYFDELKKINTVSTRYGIKLLN